MNKMNLNQKREAVEVIADSVHRALLDAKELYDRNHHTNAFLLARAQFPLVVTVIHCRTLLTSKPTLTTTPHALLKGMRIDKRITQEQFDAMHRADVICSLGWDGAPDAKHVIDVTISMLEATERPRVKQRRIASIAAENAPVPTIKTRIARWATAAAGLLTLGAAK